MFLIVSRYPRTNAVDGNGIAINSAKKSTLKNVDVKKNVLLLSSYLLAQVIR